MEGLLQILRTQFFPPHGAVAIGPKATVDLVSNVLGIPCVPLVLHCLNSLLLSLSHCMIISYRFLEVSHYPPFNPGSSIQEAILLKKLS